MRMTLYVQKDNEAEFAQLENKGDIINKLLKVYFEKERRKKEPIYVDTAPIA